MKLNAATFKTAWSWLWWSLLHPGAKGALTLKPGELFPFRELKTTAGASPDLAGFDKAVFYFYPKDDTPGCTIEAREFTLLKGDFQARKTAVFGVSADDAASHAAFCDKFSITFPLLMDPGGRLGKKLGIWKGSVHARSTVLVDGEGRVLESWDGVKALGHAGEVLARAGAAS